MRRRTDGRAAGTVGTALFWLLLWQAAAFAVDNPILLAGPFQTLSSLLRSLKGPDFPAILLYSLGRIMGGFLGAFFAGVSAGALAFRFGLLRELFRIPVGVLKSIPVASFVVLVLIWAGSDSLSVWVGFLVVLPGIYENTLAGLESTDAGLLEMARVFEIKGFRLWFYLYRPALLPYLISSAGVLIGMGFKSGAAAEIIGMPSHSFGERLYLSKISLDTAGILSWTVVLITLSALAEKGFTALLKGYAAKRKPLFSFLINPGKGRAKQDTGKNTRGTRRNAGEAFPGRAGVRLTARGVSKSYGGEKVLSGIGMTFEPGGVYCLMGASGRGKTTLLRLFMGLEEPDEGEILTAGGVRASVVFQEDRLCPEADAAGNVLLAAPELSYEEASRALLQLFDGGELLKPVSQLSGGMKRRAAVCRAVCAPGDFLLMDEPFNGLDAENKKRTADFILSRRRGRTLIMTSHLKEEAALMGAKIIFLPEAE